MGKVDELIHSCVRNELMRYGEGGQANTLWRCGEG